MLEVVRAERAAMDEIMASLSVYNVGNRTAIMTQGFQPVWLPPGTTPWKTQVFFDREWHGMVGFKLFLCFCFSKTSFSGLKTC